VAENENTSRLPRDGVELSSLPQGVRGDLLAVSALPVDIARSEARRIYCSGGEDYAIEIEAAATVLPAAKGGHWVKAWVWVPEA
jgi:hypothetical protein